MDHSELYKKESHLTIPLFLPLVGKSTKAIHRPPAWVSLSKDTSPTLKTSASLKVSQDK